MWIEPSQGQYLPPEQQASTHELLTRLRTQLSSMNDELSLRPPDEEIGEPDIEKEKQNRNGNNTFRDGDVKEYVPTDAG